jgi:hypothetical protein
MPQAVFGASGRGQANSEQQGTRNSTGRQFDQFRGRGAYPLSKRWILPAHAMETSQLLSCWASGHHNPPQRLHLLVGNLNQPLGRLRADPPQKPAVSSVQQAIGESRGDPGDRSHVVDAERAACHQVLQMGAKRPCIHPSAGTVVTFGKQRHISCPFVEAFYL